VIWLVAGIFAFGLGLSGGRIFDPPSEPPTPPVSRPLPTAVTPGSYRPAAAAINTPALAARLAFLESLTNTELEDLPDLVRRLMAERDGDWSFENILPVIDRWIELDPAGGFAFFSTEYPEAPDSPSLAMFCKHWARLDLDAALGAIETLDEAQRSGAISIVESDLANRRPADFFRLHNDHRFSHYHISQAARMLASQDLQAMLAVLPQLSDAARDGVKADIALSWAENDPDAAADWVARLDEGAAKSRAYRALAAALIKTDPARAAELFAMGGDYEGSQHLSRQGYSGEDFVSIQIAGRISGDDPLGAFEWSVEAGEDPGAAMPKFVPHSASGMIDYLADLPAELFANDDGAAVLSAPRHWRPTDVEVGLARLGEITDPQAREIAHAWLLDQQAKTDPAAALASAASEIHSPGNRSPIIKSALYTWATSDPTAASTWLTQQEPGSERDAGIEGLINASRHANPDTAIQWANEIDKAEARVSSVARILRDQPLAWAHATLESLDFTQVERESIKQSAGLNDGS